MVQTSLGVCLRSGLDESLKREASRRNEVIAREFVPIHHSKTDQVVLLVFHHLEHHLFVIDWVQVMTDDGRSQCLPSKRSHNKRVHIK